MVCIYFEQSLWNPQCLRSVGLDTPSGNLIKSNHDVQVKLADQQADPNSPLYSVKSFEELGL